MAKFDAYGGGYDPAFDDDGERHYEFQDVDLKWGLWYVHRSDWEWTGSQDVYDQLRKLWPGDSATVYTAPRKEILYGRVTITRHDVLDWRAEGIFTAGWDEVYALADTLGVEEPDDAFVESIPFSRATMDPGVDQKFEVKAQLFSELMQFIEDEESILWQRSKREWNLLCDIFRKPEYKDQ